jgi:signal transduction histidine kinase
MSFLTRRAGVGLVWQFAIAFSVMALLSGAFLYTAVRNYANDNIQASSLALMGNARTAVFSRIDADLGLAESMVQRIASLARDGNLPLHDEQRLGRFFLKQILQEPALDYISFGNEQGGITSGGSDFGGFRLIYTKGMKKGKGPRVVERVDSSGKFLARLPPPLVKDFDVRERSWYVLAKQRRRLTWDSPIFGAIHSPLFITVAYPLIGPSGEIQGVFGGIRLLDSLGSYLESHRSSPNAQLMLLEPDGTLIANSSRAPLFSEKNGKPRRLKAETVPQPFAREADGLVRRVHESGAKSFSTLLQDDEGDAYFLDIAPFVRGPDIRWYLVTAVPRSDFTGPLDALWSRFMMILLGGAIGTAGLSFLMAGWVTRPMRAISEQVKLIAAGKFGSRVVTRRRDEIGQLVHSFNDMSGRLAGTYEEIRGKNAALDAANRDLAALLEREQVRRMEAEAEGRRAHVLGEATAAMSEAQDYDGALHALPRALARSFVDWAIVEDAAPGGATRTAGAHREPEKESVLRELIERYPERMTRAYPGASVLESGELLHFPAVSEEQLRSWCVDERHAEGVLRLGARSLILVPLIARQKRVGVLALVSASERFEPADIRLAAELGRRAAMALDNARLYADLQRENAERRQAEAERRKTEEQLLQAQKMEAIGNLAGGIAHDFNNLLSIILGYSGLLVSKVGVGDVRREYVEQIDRAGVRASALTQQLLAFSRKQLLQPRTLRLSDVVAGVEPLLRRLIGENIHLTVRGSRDLGCIKADPSRLEQVVMNLAVNARDAMPDGGKLILETVNVDLDPAQAAQVGAAPGPYVMLAVTDNGMGMDRTTQARIFEPFFTTKGVGKGTGLGLSTVFGIVRQSGGGIGVESEPGRGTTFSLYFPRTEAEAWEAESEYGDPVYGTLEGSETILLVEDEEQVRTLVRTILQGFGYHVLEAQTGGDALLLSEKHAGAIDLLLTDVIMPHINGPQLAQRLGHLVRKVLYMSGYTEDSLVLQGLLDSSIALLQKPITPEALARKVREVLDSAPDVFNPPEPERKDATGSWQGTE